MSDDEIIFRQRLEEISELEVRHNIATGKYMGRHQKWAARWLAELDQRRADEADARSRASRAEDIRIARSANRAAWTAATSAMVAIIISIIALYLSWLGLNHP